MADEFRRCIFQGHLIYCSQHSMLDASWRPLITGHALSIAAPRSLSACTEYEVCTVCMEEYLWYCTVPCRAYVQYGYVVYAITPKGTLQAWKLWIYSSRLLACDEPVLPEPGRESRPVPFPDSACTVLYTVSICAEYFVYGSCFLVITIQEAERGSVPCNIAATPKPVISVVLR